MRPAVLACGLGIAEGDFGVAGGVRALSAGGRGDGLLPDREPGFPLCESPMKPRRPLEAEAEGAFHLSPSSGIWQWLPLETVAGFTVADRFCRMTTLAAA